MLYNQYLATVRDESQQVVKKLVRARNPEQAVDALQEEKYRSLPWTCAVARFLKR